MCLHNRLRDVETQPQACLRATGSRLNYLVPRLQRIEDPVQPVARNRFAAVVDGNSDIFISTLDLDLDRLSFISMLYSVAH